MIELRFYGHSDDCAEFESSDGRSDEVYIGDDNCAFFEVGPDDHATQGLVVLRYGDNGCWAVGLQQCDETVPIPADWKAELRQSKDKEYSTELVLTVPDGTQVRGVDE
jgi:hypothetical protein